jgi:hypothetical protein
MPHSNIKTLHVLGSKRKQSFRLCVRRDTNHDTTTPGLDDMEYRIRMDLPYRLRWNLRSEIDDVEIVVGSSGEETLIPLFSHLSAASYLAVLNVRRLEVICGDCIRGYELSYDDTPEPNGYQPPPSLIIENEDGKRITLEHFVTQVHAYLNKHMFDITEALRQQFKPFSDDTIWFHRVWVAGTRDEDIRLSVSLRPGMEREKMENFWRGRLIQVRINQRSCR